MAASGLILARVLPPLLPVAWPTLQPMLEGACAQSYGEIHVWDLHDRVAAESLQLWVGVRDHLPVCCAATELVTFPRRIVCRVVALGCAEGELQEALALMPKIEDWALSEGATVVEADIRPGLLRSMQRMGFSHKKFLVAKDLRGGLH